VATPSRAQLEEQDGDEGVFKFVISSVDAGLPTSWKSE